MATSLEKFQTAVTRFEGNEKRVNTFTNDPDSTGFYETNLEPTQQVETLPHLMARLRDRYLTIVFKGEWQPNTPYSQNDVVQGPDGDFWLVVFPYTSSDSILTDIENQGLIPYGEALAAAENNVRWPWVAAASVAAGEILTLPQPYLPSRNALVLFYQGTVCSPKKPGLEATGLYQYEEIGEDPNVLSNQIRVWFPISPGEVLDIFIAASAFSQSVEDIQASVGQAELAADRAEHAAARAEEIASTLYLESGVFNVRVVFTLTEDASAGTIITLPAAAKYFPQRNVLYLTYGGMVCTPYILGLTAGYQYEEVGDDPNVASQKIKIHFDVEAGVVFDLWIVTSALGRNLEAITDLTRRAEEAADRAEAVGGAGAIGEAPATQAQVDEGTDAVHPVTSKTLRNRTPRFLDMGDLGRTVETPEGAQARINRAITGLINPGDNFNDFRTNGFVAVEQGIYVNQPPVTVDGLNLKAGFLRITTDDRSPAQSVFQEYLVWQAGETTGHVLSRGWHGAIGSWGPWITGEETGGGAAGIGAYLGDIRLFPFRKTQLPSQWYACDGAGYELDSDPGKALLRLSDEFRADWGIAVIGTAINVPNLFSPDGKGYFVRAVDGTVRQVGTTQGDAIRNITGSWMGNRVGTSHDTSGFLGALHFIGNASASKYGASGDSTGLGIQFGFDASKSGVPVDDENRSLNIGMTPAIYLGESIEGGAAIGGDITVNVTNTGFNTREVITSSGAFVSEVTGWYKFILVGGGGSGGGLAGYGGLQGGATSITLPVGVKFFDETGALIDLAQSMTFSAIGGSGGGPSGRTATNAFVGGGGGGGGGKIKELYAYLTIGAVCSLVIGAGAAQGKTQNDAGQGPEGGAMSTTGAYANFCGGSGGGAGGSGSSASHVSSVAVAGPGGNGESTGLGYGGGGGGAGGNASVAAKGGAATDGGSRGTDGASSVLTTIGYGGSGGAGAIFVKYNQQSHSR